MAKTNDKVNDSPNSFEREKPENKKNGRNYIAVFIGVLMVVIGIG